MKIHLGCGPRGIPGYVNVDIVKYSPVDVVSSVECLPTFGDGCAEVIYSSHVLEHTPRARTTAVLREWYRVLQPGGTLRLAVPDFEALARLYIKLSDENRTDEDRFQNPLSFALARVVGPVVGGQTGTYDYHMALFDFASLKLQLEAIGFSDVRRYDWRTTEHAQVDDYSRSYYPHMDFEGGVLLSLNVEATK